MLNTYLALLLLSVFQNSICCKKNNNVNTISLNLYRKGIRLNVGKDCNRGPECFCSSSNFQQCYDQGTNNILLKPYIQTIQFLGSTDHLTLQVMGWGQL